MKRMINKMLRSLTQDHQRLWTLVFSMIAREARWAVNQKLYGIIKKHYLYAIRWPQNYLSLMSPVRKDQI